MPDKTLGRSDLSCDKCYGLKIEEGIEPLCETSVCPIFNLATDPVVTRMLTQYLHRRLLFEMTKSEVVYNKLCEDFGFFDDPGFHYQVEGVFLTWRNQQREQRQTKK